MTETLETTFTFRNMDPTDALRDHSLEKLEKLDKFLIKPLSAHIIFNIDGAMHMAEITLNVKGGRLIGHGTSNDMYTSIDEAVDRIKKQLARKRDRVKGHKGE